MNIEIIYKALLYFFLFYVTIRVTINFIKHSKQHSIVPLCSKIIFILKIIIFNFLFLFIRDFLLIKGIEIPIVFFDSLEMLLDSTIYVFIYTLFFDLKLIEKNYKRSELKYKTFIHYFRLLLFLIALAILMQVSSKHCTLNNVNYFYIEIKNYIPIFYLLLIVHSFFQIPENLGNKKFFKVGFIFIIIGHLLSILYNVFYNIQFILEIIYTAKLIGYYSVISSMEFIRIKKEKNIYILQ